MKNLKIGVKIIIVVVIILVLGLGFTLFSSVSSVRSTTQKDTTNRLGELANARATVVNEYFNDYLNYFKILSKQPVVIAALKNQDDPVKVAQAQKAIEAYKDSRDGMEGVFVGDINTINVALNWYQQLLNLTAAKERGELKT